jgi:uncharacterized membrane protein YdbT with pleckstrin-like domain
MKVTPEQDVFFHKKLPIEKDEVILAVYRHHPIAYILPLLLALVMIAVVAGLAFALTSVSTADGGTVVNSSSRQYVVAGVIIFSILVLVFSYIPVWTKMQDQLVLTNESILQVLQTSLFSDKISQLGLQHIADITVKAGFWGNLFGFGHLTLETPGEQDNYEYGYLSNAPLAAREISEAHERWTAALESGQVYPKYGVSGPGSAATTTTSWQPSPAQSNSQNIMIDPAEYQKFLEYQKQQNGQNPPTSPQ